ncbi:MAG: hypothetical protein IKI25_06155 [Bacteroidales bacterium]|nr:hypothetical protein [Bacteroidales bacterium]
MNTSCTKITKKFLVRFSMVLFVAGAINLYLANVVSVTSNMPKAVRPGAVIPVTVTIDKGQVEGFGRFTCTLPKDFVATSTNQNFSFADNTITVLWVKLPQSSSFSFNFNIIVPEKSKSSFNFSAKFGYVENNEKRFAELKPMNVRVIGTADEIPLENDKRVSESTGKSDDLFEVGSFDGDSDYEVTQTTETKTEYVSSKNNPELINNILSSNSAKPTMTTIDAEPSKIVQTTTTTSTTTTTTTITPIETPKNDVTEEKRMETKTTPAPTTVAKTTQTTTKPAPTLTNKNVEVKTTNNTVKNNVSYRVQVAATHKKIKNSKNFFEKRNITDNVAVEKNGAWFKYTIQQPSKTYQEARNQRNTIWEQTPIKGAFVVAYNGKKRITVQEALMMSNQKWVK